MTHSPKRFSSQDTPFLILTRKDRHVWHDHHNASQYKCVYKIIEVAFFFFNFKMFKDPAFRHLWQLFENKSVHTFSPPSICFHARTHNCNHYFISKRHFVKKKHFLHAHLCDHALILHYVKIKRKEARQEIGEE